MQIQAQSQGNVSITNVITLLEFRLDSIEQRITYDKWGTDTSHYMYYTVQNVSDDTLEYTTNSCFYYNHYQLKVADVNYDVNPKGGCYSNELTPFKLAPGNSFSILEDIHSYRLNKLIVGETDAMIIIPLVKDDKYKYRVDGRNFIDNSKSLIFKGKTKVIRNYIDNRKRKKTPNTQQTKLRRQSQ